MFMHFIVTALFYLPVGRHKYFESLKIHNTHAHIVINWSQSNAAKKKLNENISQMMQTMLYTKCAHPFAALRHNDIDTL